MRKQRISVSLPPDMLANFKDIAEASGISVSRLIYLRLKSRKKSIVVVGRDAERRERAEESRPIFDSRQAD